jgi:hypothetical protein
VLGLDKVNIEEDMSTPREPTTPQSPGFKPNPSALTKFQDFYNALDESEQRTLAGALAQTGQPTDTPPESEQMESERLQIFMDTRSKLMESLSNLAKSNADTRSKIISNMK